MNEPNLPQGWHEITLGDTSKVQSGVGFPKKYQGNLSGDFPVYKVGDISRSVQFNGGMLTGSSNYVSQEEAKELKGYIYPSGSILFAKIGEALKLNRRGYVKLPGLADNNVMGVKADFSEQDKFIYYFMMTKELAEFSRSTTVPSIRKGDVEDLALNLPPLNEQVRIANKLDELLAQVDTIKARVDAIPDILKRFRQSVLAAAVSGRLTEEWREKNRATAPSQTWPSASEIDRPFEIPESWLGVSLGSVSERVSVGHVGKTTEFYTDEANGVPFLRSQNVRPGKISKKGLTYITHEFHEKLKKSQLKTGDLLVVRVGANRGDSCVLPDVFEIVNCANIVFARPQKGLSNYLNIYFQSPKSQELLLGESVGGAQGVINTKSVQATFLALPPIEEQKEITKRVDQLFAFSDLIRERVMDSQSRINSLTQSILAKAFRGELVSQDSSDEPASELLARIQKEREEAAVLVKATKKASKKKNKS